MTITIFCSCRQNNNETRENEQIGNQNSQAAKIENTVSVKTDEELAEEFLLKLKNDRADTIIFYKRICIDCCEFYNIFWSVKGQRYLMKSYFNFDEVKTHSKAITLTSNKIFEVLGDNYTELKNTSIKENRHKQKDGTSTVTVLDHYCYTQLSIFTGQDSIITDGMKDHDFDKYTDFEISLPDRNQKRETNDNYASNFNSKWNILLTTIENEISSMTETSNIELKTLRTRNSKR
ncbi:MAG: hypothetical protein R2809_10995 [Flavobacteriales bacterium]